MSSTHEHIHSVSNITLYNNNVHTPSRKALFVVMQKGDGYQSPAVLGFGAVQLCWGSEWKYDEFCLWNVSA